MRRVLVAGSIGVLVTMGTAGSAFADAAPPASCLGHEASGISPPGSSEEFPGGVPQSLAVIREELPGVRVGAIFSTVAHLHLGSHEACDEAE